MRPATLPAMERNGPMRVVFMGTPDFAVPCLKRLLEDGHQVALVVTQSDKPKGRGHQMAPPPVKAYALTNNIEVYQPKSLKNEEAVARIAAAEPQVIVVVAYGKILPQAILDLPPFGCINVHASLLPKYRGAAPIQWAVLNGETESGVTTMQMEAGLDTGDMLLFSRCPIPKEMTAGELHDRLSADGAELLSRTLKGLEAGNLHPVKQNDEEACYASMLDKSMSPLDWSKPARRLHDQVRGLNPWPSAATHYEGKTLKIHKSRVGGDVSAKPGTIVKLNPLTIACGGGTSLILLEVQGEGAKRMTAEDYLRGHPMQIGACLGENG